ncbi:MAG: ABC transporter permease [Bacteroidota bacterium]
MIKNYFSVAFRNFWRNKTFSLINIFGLAIGISAALVIFLIVQYDFNFDKFHKDGDRIYRVVSNFSFSGEIYHNSGVTSPMGNTIRKEMTGLELVVPLRTADGDTKVSIPVKGNAQPVIYKKQEHIVFADEAYFKMIHYNWLAGSAKTSLQQAYQVVLTEKMAKQYFPTLSATGIIGKEIYFNDTVRANISGIVKDIEQNTDFVFTTFISRATLEDTRLRPEDWNEWNSTNSASQLLIKLTPGTSVASVEKGLYLAYNKYRKKENEANSKDSTAFALQPLSDIHFNSDYGTFGPRLAHKPTLYGLLAVSVFLLLLGCINFINLTTAQSTQRAKEIGIRKTLGSSKKQLITQFLSETFLITAIAALLSITITPLLLKVFADFIPEGLHFNILNQPGIILFLLILVVSVTLLSGFYPAIILSGFKPVLVLKNQAYTNTGKTRNAVLRKTLTVSQFVIAQVFIIATILVSKQISYSLNKDLGFKKDAILFLSTSYRAEPGKKFLFIDKLKAIPEIAMLSLSNTPPTSDNTWSSTMKYKDGKKEIESNVQLKMIDTNYLSLYKMKLLAGSNLPYSDTAKNMIINETYAKVLGFRNPHDAIGKTIEWNDRNLPIVGVAADFHQKSLHEIIKPLVLTCNIKQSRTLNISLQAQNAAGTVWKSAIAKIEKAWKEIYPEDDFEYHFLDESIAKYYTSEKHISSLLLWATGLAITISCLGLLGLVIYITNQRTKEIGIRKVIGATVGQLVTLLSKDFLKLIAIAFVIAVPIAWWGSYKWLENFAYKTTVSWWIFLSGGAIMFLTALIILGLRTFKAASMNPVESLRTE